MKLKRFRFSQDTATPANDLCASVWDGLTRQVSKSRGGRSCPVAIGLGVVIGFLWLFSSTVFGLGFVGGIQAYVLQGGTWVEPPIGWDWKEDELLIDPTSTATYLFAMDGCHGSSYGWANGSLTRAFRDLTHVFHIEVAICEPSDVNALVFQGVESLASPCIDIDVSGGDSYYTVGVLIRPKEGFTWGNLPNGWTNVWVKTCECFGPDTPPGGISTVVCVQENVRVHVALEEAYVDASNTTGIEDGSAEHPYSTIQAAARVVASGRIYVAPGVYSGILIADKEIHLVGQSGGNRPVIVGDIEFLNDTPYRPFAMTNMILENGGIGGRNFGLLLTHVEFRDSYTPLTCDSAGPVRAEDCVFRDCERVLVTGSREVVFDDCLFDGITGVALARVRGSGENATVRFTRCQFNDLYCYLYGGTGSGRIAYFDNCLLTNLAGPEAFIHVIAGEAVFRHSTLVNVAYPTLLAGYDSSLTFCNSILSSVDYEALMENPDSASLGVTSSCHYPALEGDYTDEQGNVSLDPMFVAPQINDFRLQVGSPCVDSAVSSLILDDITGATRDASPDMGAYEGAFSPGQGDLNDDGLVDILDVRLCLLLARGEESPTLGSHDAADIDGDGDVDDDDAIILAEYVVGIRDALP